MKVNIKVRDNYKSYCSLIDEEKILLNNKIVLDEKKNSRPDYKEKNTPTYSDVLPDDIIFTIQQKETEEKDFKFILRCVPFCERPFFRYDSTGPSHRNSNLPIPIEEQQVPTPHFHRFVADGKEIAYKTKVLLDEKQSKVLEDISMCVLHLMQEANIKFENFDLISTPGVLPFKMEENIDPLENVQFDIE